MSKLSEARYEDLLLETIEDFEKKNLGTPEELGEWIAIATTPDFWLYDLGGKRDREGFARRNRARKVIKSLKNGEIVLDHELSLRK